MSECGTSGDVNLRCVMCRPQHLHEGAEGSASSAQLQDPELSSPQRQIPGDVLPRPPVPSSTGSETRFMIELTYTWIDTLKC